MKYLFLLLFALSLLSGCGASSEDIEETITRGGFVVEKIEHHRINNNEYPVSLEALVEEDGQSLPNPKCGTKEWEYELFVDEGETQFSLRSGERNEHDPVVLYVSNRDGWIVDTK